MRSNVILMLSYIQSKLHKHIRMIKPNAEHAQCLVIIDLVTASALQFAKLAPGINCDVIKASVTSSTVKTYLPLPGSC